MLKRKLDHRKDRPILVPKRKGHSDVKVQIDDESEVDMVESRGVQLRKSFSAVDLSLTRIPRARYGVRARLRILRFEMGMQLVEIVVKLTSN